MVARPIRTLLFEQMQQAYFHCAEEERTGENLRRWCRTGLSRWMYVHSDDAVVLGPEDEALAEDVAGWVEKCWVAYQAGIESGSRFDGLPLGLSTTPDWLAPLPDPLQPALADHQCARSILAYYFEGLAEGLRR